MAHDICSEGTAEAEILDRKNGTSDATEAAKLLPIAWLSTTAGAVNGLREYEVYDFSQRPGRDLSALKLKVLDELDIRAWYLHRSQDGRLFVKNQQNLAARLRSTAVGLHHESVAKELRGLLRARFDPSVKDLYQKVDLLPAIDEVQLDQDRICLIVAEPAGAHDGLAPAKEWQLWWAQQTFKNRLLFLTGSKTVMSNVKDAARQHRALTSIEEELQAENTQPNDLQWKALDILKDRVLFQLTSAWTQAFAIDPRKPCTWTRRHTLDDSGGTWKFIEVLQKHLATAFDIIIKAENDPGDQTLEYLGSSSEGYDCGRLRQLCDALQQLVGPGSVRLECARTRTAWRPATPASPEPTVCSPAGRWFHSRRIPTCRALSFGSAGWKRGDWAWRTSENGCCCTTSRGGWSLWRTRPSVPGSGNRLRRQRPRKSPRGLPSLDRFRQPEGRSRDLLEDSDHGRFRCLGALQTGRPAQNHS